MLLNVGSPVPLGRERLRSMFGLGWDFAVDLGESITTRAPPARDTIDVLHCSPFTLHAVGGFIRVSAGPSRKAGRLILDTIPKNFPHRHATSV